MHGIFKKILTKPLWHWERWLARALTTTPNLSPIEVDKRRPPLVVLTTEKTFNNARWSAYSELKNLGGELSLTLVIDAPKWKINLAQVAQKLFPGVQLLTTHELCGQLPAEATALRKLAAQHPMGRKLATLFTLNQTSPIIFSDDDVMAFSPLTEIVEWAQKKCAGPALFIQEAATNHDPTLRAEGEEMGLRAAEQINVGLLALPKGQLNFEKLEALLTHAEGKPLSWFPDTTALAFQLAEGRGLPMETYVVNCQRQFWHEADVNYTRIKLRHFVGPVRHLLRLRGIPAFLHSCNSQPS